MPEKRKHRFGDRKDGYRLRELDNMHVFMPYIMPNRADNEAVLDEQVDIEPALKYLEKKNAEKGDDFKYTLFHLINSALAKTIYLRPKMNYFIQGHRMYERKWISFSFMVKKKFTDKSKEAFAIFKIDEESDAPIIELMHDKVKSIVTKVRVNNEIDGTTKKMGFFKKMPRFLLRIAVGIIRILDYYGKMPNSFMKDDPDYSSVFVTNLGSIKMNANYHHLVNYGTNSFFVIVGTKKFVPIFNEDGTYVMKQVVDIGMTIDERIADGVYFAKSIKLFKHIMANPELLDENIKTPIDFDLSLTN